jgi:hypothetical protein
MSYVRDDISIKLTNSSALGNFAKRKDKIIDHWRNWKPGDQALVGGTDEVWSDLKEIDNLFNVKVGL